LRVLITGFSTPHLQRAIGYALEAGADVTHVGYEPVYTAHGPPTYRFVDLSEVVPFRREVFARDPTLYTAAVTRGVKVFQNLARVFRPQVICAYGLNFLALACARARLRPLIVSAQGYLHAIAYDHAAGLNARHAEILAQTDMLLVGSPALADLCRPALPASVRVEAWCTGLNTRVFCRATPTQIAQWRQALRIPQEATVVFSPRGWEPIYHHDQVATAFAAALPRLPQPALLLFVKMGRGMLATVQSYFAEVQRQIEALGIAPQTRFLPAFPGRSMPTLYNVADVVVSYCWPDAFPSTALEALACERPMILPQLPTIANTVLARHCRLVPPGDPGALAEAMVAETGAPPTPAMRRAAREAVMAEYDALVVKERLLTLFASLDTLLP
jgi:glycosyltransferase involved in cell wall biosynthesis